MVGLGLMHHLLIHRNLLIERLLNSIPLDLKLQHSLLHKALHGLELSQLTASLLCLPEGCGLSINDIVGQFAGSEGEFSPSSLAVLLRGEVS